MHGLPVWAVEQHIARGSIVQPLAHTLLCAMLELTLQSIVLCLCSVLIAVGLQGQHVAAQGQGGACAAGHGHPSCAKGYG